MDGEGCWIRGSERQKAFKDREREKGDPVPRGSRTDIAIRAINRACHGFRTYDSIPDPLSEVGLTAGDALETDEQVG